jgi:ABC-type multidrug transport system fused ATPase/permease subunit
LNNSAEPNPLDDSIAAADAHAAAAAVDFPDPQKLRSRDIFRLVPRVWPFIKPYKRHLVYLMLAGVPGLPGGVVALAMVRVFFDAIGNGKPLTHGQAWMLRLPMTANRHEILWHACVLAGLLVVVVVPYAIALIGYGIWILQRMTNQFRVDLYTRLQELSLRFHSEEKIGDAIFRMFQDSAAIPHVINGLIIQPLHLVPLIIVNLVVLFFYDYRFAAVAAVLIPTHFVIACIFAKPLRRAFLAERMAAAQATTRIEETLASIKAVKAFGREASESELYARDNWDAFMAARRARMLWVVYRVINAVVRSLAYVAVVFFGALEVLRGGYVGAAHAAVSLGLFQGALAIFGGLSTRSRTLAAYWGGLQDVAIALSRVFEMMGKMPEEKVRSGDTAPPLPSTELAFQGVTFSYDTRAPVLSAVSFTARVGEVTSIAGPSGSGKSTLIALMLRFFDPLHGCVALDGTNIRDFKLDGYRRMISVALQENPLFTATLRENIVYGRIDATDEEVLHAATRAGLADFVRSLPSGLNTVLGEKGSKLSTGQAQRIGLARAFLRDAPILILDEPTSALDSVTEELVMQGIRDWIAELPHQRIVLVATHRRSTAAMADRIYQIAHGQVIAADDHVFDERPALEVTSG